VSPEAVGEPLFEVPNSGWYWQIRPLNPTAGRSLASPSLGAATLPLPHTHPDSEREGEADWVIAEGPAGEPLRVVELIGAVGEGADAPQYSFTVAGPLEWPRAEINRFGTILALALALTGLALLAATLLQVKVALRPLSAIERGLADIRSGRRERLDGDFPAEIAPLQLELNALITSNQDIIDRARTQVGNLAHALKTPLAVLTNEADQTQSLLALKVRAQARLMQGHVTHYLDRARMAARANTIGRVTPIRPVAEGLKRALERIHQERDITISIDCDPSLMFRGERQDLEELLGNLLDNAAKWAHGTVSFRAALVERGPDPDRPGAWLHIEIEDDGDGVPADQRLKMVRRGERLDETKPGSGLGLSIVNDLVGSYRGRLAFGESHAGGLKADVILPAAV
jgi:signal transduction histidine kinase